MTRSTGSAPTPPGWGGPPPLSAALQRLGLSPRTAAGRGRFEAMPGGSVPLYTDGEWVLKFFPPGGERFARAEWSALIHLHGNVPFEVPAPLEHFELEGWTVVGMSLLDGLPARATWSRWTDAQRQRVSHELGCALGALHAIPAPDEPALLPPGGTFDAYLRARLELVTEQPDRFAGDRAAARRAAERLRTHLATRTSDRPGVLLHTEATPEHVIVRIEDGEPRFQGLVDFESAMVGDPHYEFASIGWFWAGGEADQLAAVLAGYEQVRGVACPLSGSELIAHSLSHRYFHRRRWQERLAPPLRQLDLTRLADQLLRTEPRRTGSA